VVAMSASMADDMLIAQDVRRARARGRLFWLMAPPGAEPRDHLNLLDEAHLLVKRYALTEFHIICARGSA
jgi:hypothetical protein